jgi:hypothetical protein
MLTERDISLFKREDTFYMQFLGYIINHMQLQSTSPSNSMSIINPEAYAISINIAFLSFVI